MNFSQIGPQTAEKKVHLTQLLKAKKQQPKLKGQAPIIIVKWQEEDGRRRATPRNVHCQHRSRPVLIRLERERGGKRKRPNPRPIDGVGPCKI